MDSILRQNLANYSTMNMIKIILAIAACMLVFKVAIRFLAIIQTLRQVFAKKGEQANTPHSKQTKMVQCVYCQTYIAQDSAFIIHNQYFCNANHAKSYQQNQNEE